MTVEDARISVKRNSVLSCIAPNGHSQKWIVPPILSPLWGRPLSRSLAVPISRISVWSSGNIDGGRVASKRSIATTYERQRPHRDGEGGTNNEVEPHEAQPEEDIATDLPQDFPSPFLKSRDQSNRRIHILGTGNLGAFVAHSLAGLPARPPITLLLREHYVRLWEERGCSIDVTARGMTETKDGFDYEILPRLEKPDLSDEASVPEDAAATSEDAQRDNPIDSMTQLEKVASSSTENENLGIEVVKDLAPEDGNSIAENVQSQDAQPDVSSVAVHEPETGAKIDEGNDRFHQHQYKEQSESEERHSFADGENNADQEGSEAVIDHLLVTVKAPQTVRALQGIAHRITKDSSILFLQNGMGIIDEVNRELFPDESTRPTYLIGVVSHGIYSKGMFSVVHAGEGTIALGVMPQMPMSEQSVPEKLTELPASARYIMRTITRTPLFVAVGFQPTDLLQQQLDKIAVNCIINPLTAIFNIKNGDLLHNFSFTRVIRLLLAEISIVIRNLPELKNVPNANMRFDSLRLERLVFSIANSTAANKSSMLQDLQANKRTEIDYINGYVVKRGEEMGLHCVMNYMIVHMIKAKRKVSQKENGPLPFEGFDKG